MPLRTPRRRIAPRTKRRYRAIRNFFRKTLGDTSQSDVKTNSSTTLDVTNLRHKIGGIEDELNEGNQNCRGVSSYGSAYRRDVYSLTTTEGDEGSTTTSFIQTPAEKKAVQRDTKLSYDIRENPQSKSDNTGTADSYDDHSDRTLHRSEIMNYDSCASNNGRRLKSKKNRHCDEFRGSHTKLRKHRTQRTLDNGLVAESYHSLATVSAGSAARYVRAEEYVQKRVPKQACQQYYTRTPSAEQPKNSRRKDKPKHYKSASPTTPHDDNRGRGKKNKADTALDQDFIADIIQKQYKPVKLFGRRESDLSQMSTPVCRDIVPCAPCDRVNDSELCSCCVPGRAKHGHASDVSDMRSLCDMRLYNSHRRTHSRHRKQHLDVYNDSNLYDVVPVKEMTSPMSRRKFVEDHLTSYECLKEVPPSPRTHKPRLNLEAQNYEYESNMFRDKQSRRKRSPQQPVRQEYVDTFAFRSQASSEESGCNEYITIQPQPVSTRNAQIQEDMGPANSSRYPTLVDDNTNTVGNDILNKTDANDENTDKALCEIKDILQSFLLEIKKHTATGQSEQSSETATKIDLTKQCDEFQRNGLTEFLNGLQNNGFVDNNCGVGQCSLPGAQPVMPPPGMPLPGMPPPGMLPPGMPPPGMPPPGVQSPALPPPYLTSPYLTNPCCYPLLCSMNGMQNGYPSCTCHGCGNCPKDCDVKHAGCSPKDDDVREINSSKKTSETDNLIREIYKYVAQNSNIRRQSPECSPLSSPREAGGGEKTLTSRGVGKNNWHLSQHDANVGTLPMLCSSKSCEAVGSRAHSDAFYARTNASYSDTVLEKFPTEITPQSTTALDTTDSSEKRMKSKFASVLQTIGLFKRSAKAKKDVIEEISESESTTGVDVNGRVRYPFRQNVTNYMMHEQEYFHPPTSPRGPQFSRDPSPHYDYGYSPYDDSPMESRFPNRSHSPDRYDPYRKQQRDQSPPPARMHPQASAPPYPHPCDQYNPSMQPQVPLCLKEIEVKSTGTQSERKMTFFYKLSQKAQAQAAATRAQAAASRDQAQATNFTQPAKKPGLWNTLQARAAATKYPDIDPYDFALKSQKTFANGEKVKKAVIKKLFYKRNPFSPRNLIVRTLLGKDKSSFGIPPSNIMQRPRMFF